MTGIWQPRARRFRLQAAAVITVLALVVLGAWLATSTRTRGTDVLVLSPGAGQPALGPTTVPPALTAGPTPATAPTTTTTTTRATTTTAAARATTTITRPPAQSIGRPPPVSTTLFSIPPPTASSQPLPPSTGALRDHLIDSSLIPQGFASLGIDEGLVNAPRKLDSAGERWTRALPGGRADYISLFATRFSTPEEAAAFNAGFSREYGAGNTGVVSVSVPDLPGGVAYRTTPTLATAWFNVGPVAVGLSIDNRSDDPLRLAEALAQAEYGLLR